MSQTVNFQNIPPNLQVPLFWVETNNSQAGVNLSSQRVLLVGGTLTAMPSTPVWAPPPAGSGAPGAAQAVAAATGAGSMLSAMVGSYRLNDAFTEVWVLPIPDPVGGAAATGTITINGTATAAGTLSFYVGGALVQCPVAVGQKASDVAYSLAAVLYATTGLQANLTGTPTFTFPSTTTGAVTVTAKHKGVCGNQVNLAFNLGGSASGQSVPAGLTVSVSGMSGGTGVPTLSSALAALGTMPFDFIVSGFNDSTSLAALTALTADGAGRWGWTEQLFGGTFAATVDTATNLLTLGATLNDQHQCMIGANGTPTPPWQVAAAVMGAAVPYIVAQPNIPLDGLTVQGVMAPPAPGNGLSISTLQSLLSTGISPLLWDRAGACKIVRLVTEYQTNGFGVADQSYFDIGVLYTLMAVLRTLKASATQRLAQKLLVDNGTPIGAGQPAISPAIERMNIYHDYLQMQSQLLVEDPVDFLAGLTVVRNVNNPTRLDVLFDPHLISGLHVYAVLNQFVLRAGAPSPAATL